MLSPRELEQFYTEGWVVKEGLLDTELCRRAREHAWAHLPSRFLRSDPSTWLAFSESEETPTQPPEEKTHMGPEDQNTNSLSWNTTLT